MATTGRSAEDAARVFAIREFNRFYTARLGLLRKRYLGGEFSLTEARVLYEIASTPDLTASALRNRLGLDAGYVSRTLSLLTRRKLVRQTASGADGREKLLTLSAMGRRKLAQLNEHSARQIEGLLQPLSAADRDTVVAFLSKVRLILSQKQEPIIRIVRLSNANEDAIRLLEEYYEAVDIARRDSPEGIQEIIDHPASGMWLAYLEDKAVGCVVLRKLESIPLAGECKRLYVQPHARGRGIANALLDALEECACHEGLRWVYLDSHESLKAAAILYQKRHFGPCKRYNDNPQANVFLRKRLGPGRSPSRSRKRSDTERPGLS